MHAYSIAQSCPTLCDPMNCSPPGSSVHGVFLARILEWVVISYPRGSSRPRDQTHIFWVSCFGKQIFFNNCATGEAFTASLSKKCPLLLNSSFKIHPTKTWGCLGEHSPRDHLNFSSFMHQTKCWFAGKFSLSPLKDAFKLHLEKFKKTLNTHETSLTVQWLRLRFPVQRVWGRQTLY